MSCVFISLTKMLDEKTRGRKLKLFATLLRFNTFTDYEGPVKLGVSVAVDE